MFDNFSKTNYYLNGQTVEVTDIFKNIKLDFSNFLNYTTKKNQKGLRPDQFSYEVYNDPKKFWLLLLANDIKNPFTQWNQGQSTFLKQNEAEYDTYVFQFANTSKYLPGNTLYYGKNATDSYLGISLINIQENDIIVYSVGDNSDRFTSFGAGQIYSSTSCGTPHFGQSLIPTNFANRNDVVKISAGGNVTSCTDSMGRIWSWGEPIGLTKNGWIQNERLYNSPDSGYEILDTTKNKIIGTKSNTWNCFGDGCTSTISYPVSEPATISKVSFTKGNIFSGIVLFTNGSIQTYGGITHTTVNSTYSDIGCSDTYCLGLVQTGPSGQGKVVEFNYSGVSTGLVPSITPKVTKIACGKTHSLLLDENGTINTIGTNDKNRLNLSTTKTYTDINAGEYFSVGIDSDANLVVAGEILQNSGSCSGATAYIGISTINGTYNTLACGDNHVICLGSGTSKQYSGRVIRTDLDYKRVFVKSYTAPDFNPVLFDDPAGTNINIFRNSGLITNIQHQLLSIDTYVNTTQYVKDQQNNTVLNISENDGLLWKNTFIVNYKNAENLDYFMTPFKLQIQKLNTDIKMIDINVLYTLEKTLKDQLPTENKIYIKLSEL